MYFVFRKISIYIEDIVFIDIYMCNVRYKEMLIIWLREELKREFLGDDEFSSLSEYS